MYESSSESSIEHGNFPSVINLYAAGKDEESDLSDYAATGSSAQSEVHYQQPISYVENVTEASFVSQLPVPMSQSQIYFAQDRLGSCGSPVSSSDSDTDSDATCGGENTRRNSTTSTSTNSSDEERLPKTVRTARARTGQIADVPYSTPNKSSIYHISGTGQALIHHPLLPELNHGEPLCIQNPRTIINHYQDPINGAPSSPSSRTASSSNSGKTVRLSGRRVIVGDSTETHLIMGHLPQSCHFIQNRVECSLSRGAAESMGLHSQAADSGISNTSPETQSSTEFHQRKIQDTIMSGKVSHTSSGRFSVPSLSFTGGIFKSKSLQTSRISSAQYPQSILKFSKDQFSMTQMAGEFRMYLFNIISTMYAMLLLVISTILPIMEISSPYKFLNAYEGFYIFLYTTGILFFVYIYGYLLRDQTISKWHLAPLCSRQINALNSSIRVGNVDLSSAISAQNEDHQERYCEMEKLESNIEDSEIKRYSFESELEDNYYNGWVGLLLRLTVLAMGVVSMVRDGLLFGRVLDSRNSLKETPSHCKSSQVAVRCIFSLIYTFIQLYFIFINSKICIQRFQIITRLGLMHIVVVNLASLIRTTIKDSVFEQPLNSKFEILTEQVISTLSSTQYLLKQEGLYKLKGGLSEEILFSQTKKLINDESTWSNLVCRGGDLMDGVIQASDPYIYPCTIQYCLITAAMLWITWRNSSNYTSRLDTRTLSSIHESGRNVVSRRKRNVATTATADCSGSNKGLFVGLVAMVATIVNLVVFHILMKQKSHLRLVAVRISFSFEIALLISATVASVLACFKMQDLLFQLRSNSRCIIQGMEESLLLFSMIIGVYFHAVVNIVVGQLHSQKPPAPFLIIGSLLSLLQVSIQTIFIFTGLRRASYKTIHDRDKPGRELIAFLLLTNIALWCLHMFEQQRLESTSNLHQKVLGAWPWAIINHVTIPMILTYRMVSAITLLVIWRQAYRVDNA